jgi:hypothetical protein
MSIDDINKVRGKLLFWKVIRESGLDGKYLDRATELAKGFENQVGISGDCEAIYPAKRLATAILEVATWDYEIAGFDLGPDQVLKYFSENLKDNNPANIERSTFIPSGEQLNGNWGREVAAESDTFEKELRANAESADIDLLDEFTFEEMTVEGLRKSGIIDSNFNAANSELPTFSSEAIKLGKIYFNDDGAIESVECPECGKRDCYVISLDKYGCFVCDAEFKVPMEMSDNL